MKRWIHAASLQHTNETKVTSVTDPLRNADPFQAKRLGWNYEGRQYARGKSEYDAAKAKLINQYGKDNVKVFRVATDTPGMLMYDVYTRITDKDTK